MYLKYKYIIFSGSGPEEQNFESSSLLVAKIELFRGPSGVDS